MNSESKHNRRDFIKSSAIFAGGSFFLGSSSAFGKTVSNTNQLNVSIFSKHLQFLSYDNMAEAAREIGFDGVDLTIRPNGHVLPENVTQDLPKATEALKKHDLPPFMFTSNVSNSHDPLQLKVLETAAAEGFKCYRTDWLKYADTSQIEQELTRYNKQLSVLADTNEKLKLCGGYQNHAGTSIGSPIWDIKQLLKGIDPEYLGLQYDIRHATVEGANSWELGFMYIKNHINSLVIKDFKWGVKNGKVQLINTPLGQGMVSFDHFFKLLKKFNIHVPVSLHLEYDLGGAEKGQSKISMPQKEVFNYMKHDLEKLKQMWNDA